MVLSKKLGDLEPYTACIAALHMPGVGIVDYASVGGARVIIGAGGERQTGEGVEGVREGVSSCEPPEAPTGRGVSPFSGGTLPEDRRWDEVGPNAVLGSSQKGYEKTGVSFRDPGEVLSYAAF